MYICGLVIPVPADGMSAETVSFTAPLRVWPTGKFAGMAYVSIGGEAADAIRAHELVRRLELGRRRGLTSVKVNATIGDSPWSTSVFPVKEAGWFLPIKKEICRAQRLEAGDEIAVPFELL